MRRYRQISDRDRVKISRLKVAGLSDSAIARKTGFHRATILREFRRNSEVEKVDSKFWQEMSVLFNEPAELPRQLSQRESWTAESASKLKRFRTWKANQIRRRKDKKVMSWAIAKLKAGWTPEQIAGRSYLEGPGSISYECIYKFIALDRKRGGRLFTFLPRFKKRKRRSGRRIYDIITDRIFIDKRPKIVEKRVRLGDLEADLIVGKFAQGYLLTVVDRVSRKVVIKKLTTKKKDEVFLGLCRAIEEFKVVKTLTVDNGREFSDHKKLAKEKRIKIFFARPYTSQDKGTVEHTNGLLRRYFGQETNFKEVSSRKIRKVQDQLNNRPRKVLNYLTPNEAHNKKMGKKIAKFFVALDS
jgi:IS30 family transposase